MEKKISIIVPIYNVEKYLKKGISSLLEQSHSNLEIILVDDGSTDSSGSICDEFAAMDERILVIHSTNRGQSHARNEGLKRATGDYIGFMDGDDAAAADMYQKLLKLAEREEADIAECNFIGRKSKEPDRMDEGAVVVMTGREAITRQLDMEVVSRFPSTSLWSKIFRAEILKGLTLPEGLIHEEYAFLCQAFLRCGQYVYVNEPLYERTLRSDSTTAAAFSERAFDKLKVFRIRSQFLKDEGEEELYRLSRQQEFELMLHYYGEAHRVGLRGRAEALADELKLFRREIFQSRLSGKKKGKFYLFFFSPALYVALRNRK